MVSKEKKKIRKTKLEGLRILKIQEEKKGNIKKKKKKKNWKKKILKKKKKLRKFFDFEFLNFFFVPMGSGVSGIDTSTN